MRDMDSKELREIKRLIRIGDEAEASRRLTALFIAGMGRLSNAMTELELAFRVIIQLTPVVCSDTLATYETSRNGGGTRE